MIKGLLGSSGVTVSSGSTGYPFIPQNANNPIQGMIRLNGNDMQVFNGTDWYTIPSSFASVGLDQDTLDLLMWVKAQRQMALNRMTLAQNNPALLKALEAVKRAEDNFEILAAFVEHETS